MPANDVMVNHLKSVEIILHTLLINWSFKNWPIPLLNIEISIQTESEGEKLWIGEEAENRFVRRDTAVS